jgi:ribosome-associated heat shock protein Hsp15
MPPTLLPREDDVPGRVRLDKWLWAARFYKTRALAAEAIDAGRIEVNGDRAKRARLVAPGDTVRVRKPPFEQVVQVRATSEQRGPAAQAALLYEETAASRTAREVLAKQMRSIGPPVFREKGRPTKRDRREIDRWRGRDDR